MLLLTGGTGATLIITSSKIFTWLRRISPFPLHCAMCTGFWVGFILALMLIVPHCLIEVIWCLCIGWTVSLLSTFTKFLFDLTGM